MWRWFTQVTSHQSHTSNLDRKQFSDSKDEHAFLCKCSATK